MRKVLVAVAVATAAVAIAAGCGKKSSGPSNSVTGTIGGNTFVPKSSIFADRVNSPTETFTFGIQSDSPTLCADFTALQLRANTHIFAYEMGTLTNDTSISPVTSTGIYPVVDVTSTAGIPVGAFAVVIYEMIDNSCNEVSTIYSQAAGAVDVTGASSSTVKGKGAGILMSSGDAISTKFNLAQCPGLATFFTTTSSIGCAH